jgi:hypothetical protein
MFGCMYVYMYTYLHICYPIYIHIYMYIDICINIYIYIYTQVHSVRAILEELKRPWQPIAEGQRLRALSNVDGPEEDHGREKEVCEVVYEEVVPFEEWMVSREQPMGVSTLITGKEWGNSKLMQKHPEMLITEVDLEEDRDSEEYIQVSDIYIYIYIYV